MSAPVVSNAPERNRFEIHLDGTLAGYVDYEIIDGAIALTHTQVLPEFGGRGIGTTLIVETLTQISAIDGAVLPYCSFIPKVIREHPQFLDLVPAAARPQFGL